MAKYPPGYLNFLKVGNPWLVGHNVNRIVPVHALQAFLSTVYKDGSRVQELRDLARGEAPLDELECFERWKPNDEQVALLQDSMFAVLAPDRRLFRTRKGTGPSDGSLTPLVTGMVASTPADDGLGKRVGQLLSDCLADDWGDRLDSLLTPDELADPVTGLVATLVGDKAKVNRREQQAARAVEPRNELEVQVAGLIGELIRDLKDARRLLAIQELGRGVYFGAVWLMAAAPLWAGSTKPGKKLDRRLVFVYSGMPPGNQHNPLVLAAARSFQRLVDANWTKTVLDLHRRIARERAPSTMRPKEQWEYRLRSALIGPTDRQVRQADQLIEFLGPAQVRQACPTEEWCREALERLGVDKHALGRRLRSLGANIGFAGPDRGRGLPRFYCETPLLGTLVRGVCGGQSMRFEAFSTALRERFGIVFGPGDDEDTWERLGPIWGGSEGEELLKQNEDELRRRLVRAGLARTYSDSHTEVTPRG